MVLGVLLLLAAIALVGYNRWDNYRAGKSAAEVQTALEDAINSAAANNVRLSPDDRAEDMGTVAIDDYEYIGTLTIPSLNLDLAIISDWSYAGLKITPARYSGSVSTDDLVICGHNYTHHFGNLKYLESGDTVYFKDINGSIYNYEVLEIETLQDTAIEEMTSHISGDWDLTLFTCTLDGQTRITVRCGRTE